MNLADNIKDLISKIEQKKKHIKTEEATKTVLVYPFVRALGYDTEDPTIVIPEFIADIGKKKGEKVDIAILKDESPVILIEVKHILETLDKHSTQLERYFGTTEARFGILTNGLEYRFYSDLEKLNVMDKTPFMIFNLEDMQDRDIKELEHFTAENLDIDSLEKLANKRRYITIAKNYISKQLVNPDDSFIRLIGKECGVKVMNANKIEEFTTYTRTATSEVLNDMANKRLGIMRDNLDEHTTDDATDDDGIITTEEELNGFFIVKSILAEFVDNMADITARDTLSYFGILFKDNNRKWICRLHFNAKQLYLGYRVDNKEETKQPIEKVEDLYKYKTEIVNAYNFALE